MGRALYLPSFHLSTVLLQQPSLCQGKVDTCCLGHGVGAGRQRWEGCFHQQNIAALVLDRFPEAKYIQDSVCSVWVPVWWVCVPTGSVLGVRLCAPGLCMHVACGTAVCDPCGGSGLGECAHVYYSCTTPVCLCTFAISCSGWDICTCFGGTYTCVRVAFYRKSGCSLKSTVLQCQLLSHLLRSPGRVLKVKIPGPQSRPTQNLQGWGLGTWIIARASRNTGAKPCLRTTDRGRPFCFFF